MIDTNEIKEALNGLAVDGLKRLDLDARMEFKKSILPSVSIRAFDNVHRYIDIVVKSRRLKSMIIEGEAGLGKSTDTLSYLTEKKIDFAYLNNYTTPLAFYNFAYNHRKELIVLDDIEGLLRDTKGLSLLKAMTDTKRAFVSYTTTAETREAPPSFIFEGKLIILTNDMPTTHKVRSLVDRAIVRTVNLTLEEKKELIIPILGNNYPELTPEAKKDIYGFLVESLDDTVLFSFRTVIRVAEFYLNNREKWKELAKEELRPDEDLALIRELQSEYPKSVGMQAKDYVRRTSKCRATFYNKKKLLKKSKSISV